MNNQTQEALKMALNAMANKMESDNNGNPLTKYDEALQEAMDAGVEVLATNKDSSLVQPTQEPVAWQWLKSGHMRKKIPKTATPEHWRPLYTHPASQPAQGIELEWYNKGWDDAKKEFIGLMDDEMQDVFNLGHKTFKEFARAIEQALKEKNT